jgi:hypothetical protein
MRVEESGCSTGVAAHAAAHMLLRHAILRDAKDSHTSCK